MVSGVTSTSAMLTWNAPAQKGTPVFNFYKVTVQCVPCIPEVIQPVFVTSASDMYISDLIPGTSYIATIAAVIANNNFPLQEGESSFAAAFTTEEQGYLYCSSNRVDENV